MVLLIENQEKACLLVETHGNTEHVIWNKPESLNIMHPPLFFLTAEALRKIERRNKNKLIIIRSYGHKVFSAGANLKQISRGFNGDSDECEIVQFGASLYYTLIHLVGNMKNPIVSVLDGISMGGGAMTAAAAPFRIATENTIFAMPETKVGSFVDAGSSYRLSRMDRNLGLYIALTGSKLMAEDVYYCGIATHFVKSANIDAMYESLSKLENPSHNMINEVIEQFMVPYNHKPISHALTIDAMKTIERCFGQDSVTEIVKALQADNSPFALRALKQMSTSSPTSLALTFETIKRGKSLSFINCLRMERHVWSIITYHHEFVEGISAFFNKRKPNWKPSRIEDVDLETDIHQVFFKNALSGHKFDDIWNIHEDFDCTHAPSNTYALPLQSEIISTFRELNHDFQSTLDWFMENHNYKYGIKQKVEDVLHEYIPLKSQEFLNKL